ncbi:18960_t:CDS:2 [Gigaspora margarita]|uniref:18960_t:CDS:1 n=1 Tax=Gigaspora margarita TaxID=4874 RepID=A0ABN7V535_GIGMA|nr:18960_t:CDS:2 [Gigaspora margarita]
MTGPGKLYIRFSLYYNLKNTLRVELNYIDDHKQNMAKFLVPHNHQCLH